MATRYPRLNRWRSRQAAVSWNLIEDSLNCHGALSCSPAIGSTIGSLTFDDFVHGIGGSIGYHYLYLNNPPGTGDTDFSLHLSYFSLPVDPLVPASFDEEANVALSFDGNGNIGGTFDAGHAFLDNTFLAFELGNNNVLIQIGVEGVLLGCGPINPGCDLTAHWVLTSALPVPEPSGIALLGTAIGLFAFLGLSRGRKRVYG